MEGIYYRKYGVQTTIPFELFEVDGVDFRVDAADGGSDCSISKDEGAEATCTNDFSDEGTGYSLVISATEMEAARIKVYIIDQSGTKVWLDKSLTIETYGHASAQHAIDPSDGVRMGLTALPNAAADGAGGLPISDAGGLDLDTKLANTNEITVARMGALTDWIDGGRLDLILDIIAADVVNLDGDAMRGTDAGALASVCTEGRLAELDAANLPSDIDTLITRITAAVALASVCTEVRLAELDAGNLPTDIAAIPTTAMRGTDGANTTVPDAAGTAAGLHTTTDGLIGALNNVSIAQVTAACDSALAANDEIIRILGLSRSNVVYDTFVFDGNDDETSRIAWVYDSKANAQTHDESTGLIGKYAVATTWAGGKPTKVTWTKES